MFRKVFILMAIVLVLSICYQAEAVQISCSWVGCEDGLWGDPSNWDCATAPDNNETNTFFVTIDTSSCPYQVEVGLQQSRDVNELDCYGNVDLEAWTSGWVELTIYNGLTNYGDLEIEDIQINGNVTNLAGANLDLWDIRINGNLFNDEGGTIIVDDEVCIEGEATMGGNLENSGTIEIVPASELSAEAYFNNLGKILIYDGECGTYEEGILDNNSTGLITGFGVLYAGQLLRNKGQICAFGGSLAIASEGSLINTGLLRNEPLSSLQIKPSLHTVPAVDVNNFGTIEVNAGGGVAFDCNLVNEPNGVIELLGGTLAATTITQTADANFAGFGSITGDVIIDPNGLIELTGPTNIIGDVNIPAGATLKISDGQTLIAGHTTCDGTIHLIGGTVIFQGGCDCNDCNITHNPGIDRNHFDINADGIVNLKDFASFANTWLWQATWY